MCQSVVWLLVNQFSRGIPLISPQHISDPLVAVAATLPFPNYIYYKETNHFIFSVFQILSYFTLILFSKPYTINDL